MTTAVMSNQTASPDGPDEVLGLLREQASLYVRLEAFASRQRKLITTDESGPLLSLLADRQKLSTELTRLAVKLEPIRRGWVEYRGRLSPPQRAEADGLVSDAAQRLQRVIESDEQDARLLSLRKHSVADGLRAAHATGHALQAYRAPSAREVGTYRLDEGS